MTITVATGVTTLRVRTAAMPGALYAVSTPDTAGILPALTTSGSSLDVQFVGDGQSGPSIAAVILNDTVRWRLQLDGGSTDAIINFADGGFGSIDFASGVSTASVTLPRPSGDQRLSEEGGASSFHVALPNATPTLVRFSAGAGSAALEGHYYSGFAGGRMFQLLGWSVASDRIDIDLAGGVSQFVVTDR
jgi:hypothetical protein